MWQWKMRSAAKHVAHWAHTRASFERLRKRLSALVSRRELRRIIKFDTTQSQWLLDRRHAVAIFSRSKQLAAAMAQFRRHAMLRGASAYCYARSSFARLQRRAIESSQWRHERVTRQVQTAVLHWILVAVARAWRQWCSHTAETGRLRRILTVALFRCKYRELTCGFFGWVASWQAMAPPHS